MHWKNADPDIPVLKQTKIQAKPTGRNTTTVSSRLAPGRSELSKVPVRQGQEESLVYQSRVGVKFSRGSNPQVYQHLRVGRSVASEYFPLFVCSAVASVGGGGKIRSLDCGRSSARTKNRMVVPSGSGLDTSHASRSSGCEAAPAIWNCRAQQFKLWGGNPELIASCGVSHPEECSSIIFEQLWQSLRAGADPELIRQLDCQFQLTERIEINYKGFDNLTLGKMLNSVQEQIDQQLSSMAKPGAQMCQTSLRLVPTGDPNCFVRAEFSTNQPPRSSLDHFWGWIGWRNGFEVLHNPPNIRSALKFL